MKLSVITCTYNAASSCGEGSLRRCLLSVAKLKVSHEHIIQDGGSSDATRDIVRDVQDSVPELLFFQEADRGIYNALNRALAKARGDWIYIIGADDWIVHADIIDAAIQSAEDRNKDMIAAPVMTRSDGSSILTMRPRKLFTYMPYPHQGFLIRRARILALHGFNERYKIIADYDQQMRALLHGWSVYEIDRPFAFYGTDGFSNNCDQKIIAETCEMLSELFGLMPHEYANVRPRGVVPLRMVLRFLLHSSPLIRRAARFQFLRWGANGLGLIDNQGRFILNQ